MGLVRDWRRQAARAAGVSLIAPAALLVAATVVAASGGGLGGVGSLGQLATGPSLPDTGLAGAPKTSLDGTQFVGVELGAPSRRGAAEAVGRASDSIAPAPSPAPAPAGPAAGGGGTGAPDVALVPDTSVDPGRVAPASPPREAAPEEPIVQPPPPPPSDPVGELLEDTDEILRGTGELLNEITKDLSTDLLPQLLGQPPR